jgi:hypothetical protein
MTVKTLIIASSASRDREPTNGRGWTVEVQLTFNTHYNPCFWTAHWNAAYFDAARRDMASTLTAREQPVHVLNFRANKVFEDKVENLHCDRGMGLAEITPEEAKEICKRRMPDEYEESCKQIDADGPGGYVACHENLFTLMEKQPFYETLVRVIRRGRILHSGEKGFLAVFLAFQHLRSHGAVNSMAEGMEAAGLTRFELFLDMRNALSDPQFLSELTDAMLLGEWQFYRTEKDEFPLTDSPLLLRPETKMIAISPRLLLEIKGSSPNKRDSYTFMGRLPPEKLDEFRCRTIANTFREIIFSSRERLEAWRLSTEFSIRRERIMNQKGYNRLIGRDETGCELWEINANANIL